jgi:hypothetical protein
LTLRNLQTRIGGHTTPSQSSMHAPCSQCFPPSHATPAHARSTQVGAAALGSHVSPAGQHAHAVTQRPPAHAPPFGHVTSAQGSTQPEPRQS